MRDKPSVQEVTRRAAKLVSEAMDLLDGHGVAPEVAAQLALAQQQLRQLLDAKEDRQPEG